MDFGTFRRLLLLPPRRLLRPPWFPSPWLFWPLLPPRPRPREPRERFRRLVFSPWFLFSELFSEDRKSTRLNSSHVSTSYAVFCSKKKQTARQRGRST